MTTTFEKTDKAMIVKLAGRLDTACSAQVTAEIDRTLAEAGEISALTCDCEHLEYISSSGLRILLMLSRRYKDFTVVNVQPQVYDVLETTGFTKIMQVSRAMRLLSVEGCQLIGIGGVGKVYRLDGDTIIKVFREGTTLEEVRHEIAMSKEAFVLGMPTAISFDVVRVPVDDGECYGLVYELLRAETLSSMIAKHPERIDEFAQKYAHLFLQLHDIEVPTDGHVPSAIERERRQVEHIGRYFPQQSIDMMRYILDAIPEGNRLLHMDLQTKNAMIQDGELMLIDMGEIGYGNPVLDLGHAYSAMVALVGDYEKIIGLPKPLGVELWNKAIDIYLAHLSADEIAKRKAQIEVVGCVRTFSWLSLSDSFPEEVINECRTLFDARISNRFDYIKEVCKTFK